MKNGNDKKIWIDLENSPHVPFFKPIINRLESLGYTIFITARKGYQVCSLAEQLGVRCKEIGRHYGRSKFMKVVGLGVRVMQLAPEIIKEKPVLALAHGSRTQLVLAYLLRIPCVQVIDYEYVARLPFFHARWLIAPEIIPSSAFVIPSDHIFRYPGIKEDVYVPEFRPEPGILREFGISESELVVTIRPPATEAHYHKPESAELFQATIDWLANVPDVRMILLPRNERQSDSISKMWPQLTGDRKLIIPETVVDGLNLLWHSDLVISGGGTMNREAAALGVPVYSIYRGKIGAVDRYLSDNGRLVLLEKPDDLRSKVVLKKWSRPPAPDRRNLHVLETIVQHITEFVEKISKEGIAVKT